MHVAFGRGIQLATAGGFSPFLREQLVGASLLDVVGFARKDYQRLVLRLPTKTRDGPRIALPVLTSGDSHDRRVLFVRKNRRIGDGFYQTRPERRSRDSENQVCTSGIEIRLRDIAARSIRSAGDREQIMHATVGFESRFPDWAVNQNEKRHGVRLSSR